MSPLLRAILVALALLAIAAFIAHAGASTSETMTCYPEEPLTWAGGA